MTAERPSTATEASAWMKRWEHMHLKFLVSICLSSVVWLGCSVEEHYDILCTFFDGVPDPNAPATESGSSVGGRMAGLVYYTHKPYKEEACAECHEASRRLMLTKVRPTICLKCHADVPGQYETMHGPVVANACIWCHAPHESTIQPLLKARAPEMCLQCHGVEMEVLPQPPEHDDLERDCLECHRAHGGEDAYFLLSQLNKEETGPISSEPADAGEE